MPRLQAATQSQSNDKTRSLRRAASLVVCKARRLARVMVDCRLITVGRPLQHIWIQMTRNWVMANKLNRSSSNGSRRLHQRLHHWRHCYRTSCSSLISLAHKTASQLGLARSVIRTMIQIKSERTAKTVSYQGLRQFFVIFDHGFLKHRIWGERELQYRSESSPALRDKDTEKESGLWRAGCSFSDTRWKAQSFIKWRSRDRNWAGEDVRSVFSISKDRS